MYFIFLIPKVRITIPTHLCTYLVQGNGDTALSKMAKILAFMNLTY